MIDLISDEPFTKNDIITLQDPLNIDNRDLSKFDYVKRELKTTKLEIVETINTKAIGSTATLLKSTLPTKAIIPEKKFIPIPHNISTVSSGRTAASFTSTALTPQTTVEHALWDEEDLMMEVIGKKKDSAFVRLVTNFGEFLKAEERGRGTDRVEIGNLNLELFCDRAPRTCYNFIQLAIADK